MKGLVMGVFCGGVLALAVVQVLIKNNEKSMHKIVHHDQSITDSVFSGDLEKYTLMHQQQIEEIKQDQNELKQTLMELNRTIKSVKNDINRLTEKTSISLAAQEYKEESELDLEKSRNQRKIVTEMQLSQYVDNVIENDGWDEHATNTAWAQTHQVLETMPGVLLDDIQCGTNICRASFARIDGEVPDISNIWGNPPFVSEGFTIPQKDGSVILYFTSEGSSVNDFRALASEENI